jgi:NAD-dependent deacetylase
VLLAVGTTLQVHPAAGLCDVAKASGAQLVIVNGGPTAYDAVADRVIVGSIADELPALVVELTQG